MTVLSPTTSAGTKICQSKRSPDRLPVGRKGKERQLVGEKTGAGRKQSSEGKKKGKVGNRNILRTKICGHEDK